MKWAPGLDRTPGFSIPAAVGDGGYAWSPILNSDGQLVKNFAATRPRRSYETVCGTLESLAGQQFDTIMYIDVLEHIDNDREELSRAASHLRPDGHLIVLAPAHQRLFSPFDTAIGHFRRYNRPMLRTISPASLRLERMRYLDCAGLILSAANTDIAPAIDADQGSTSILGSLDGPNLASF